MSENKFIGRGENTVEDLLKRLFPSAIIEPQVEIRKLITHEDYNFLGEWYRKHKFDFVVKVGSITLGIEVNYKHTAGISRKWINVYEKLLKKYKIIPVPINDHASRHLFTLTQKKEHILNWDDFRDIIDALETAGVKP